MLSQEIPQTIEEWEAWQPLKPVMVRPTLAKIVTLERVLGGPDAKPPRGTHFTYSYKSLSGDAVMRRATKALEREYPGANRLDWRLVK